MNDAVRPVIFGKYCLLERISVGGMAEVFRARPFNAPSFKRFLAVKRILPNLAEDEQFISMFVDEAKITVQLNHRQICQIYELGRLQDSFYIVMEFIAGKNLLQIQNHFRTKKRLMSVTQAAWIALNMCEGLDYAHRKADDNGNPLNIIHRDISPQNILVSYDGDVKVIDFGIARAASKNQQTQVGVLKGKFGYMSPEQASGGDIDHRSDVFAVGCLLWEMLTSRRLFHGKSDFETLEKVRAADVQPPSERNGRVPEEIDRIVLKALSRDRDERYQWASEVADDLRAFLSSIKPRYSERTLSQWMVSNFTEDLENERRKLPLFDGFVSVEDVLRHNETVYEEIGEEDLEMVEEEDATRVFDPEGGGSPSAPGERVLASNDDEPMATVVMLADEIRLPDAPLSPFMDPDEVDESPLVTSSLPAVSLGAPRRKSNGGSWLLGILALVTLAALGFLGWKYLQPTTATLEISTTPAGSEVQVSLNGEPVEGHPPLTLRGLPAGPIVVQIDAPGFQSVLEPIELQAGITSAFRRTLAPIPQDGTVRIQIPDDPEAAVYLDGVLVGGNGAEREFTASSGDRHVVEVYLPGHFVESYEFTLGSAEEFRRTVELRAVIGTLRVSSTPDGDVLLDGEERGNTSERLVIEGLDVATVYELQIRPSVAGFRELSQHVVFDTYYDLRLSPRLPRVGATGTESDTAWGFITTDDSDRWYRVFVDGRDTGFITPITQERPLPLKTGERRIRFVRAGEERETTIVVQPEQTFAVAIPPGE
jgi:serine/threonine protein kinase